MFSLDGKRQYTFVIQIGLRFFTSVQPSFL